MYVVKRDGHKEPVMFDKITARVRKLCYSLNELVDPVKVSMRVIEGLYDGVTTSELDNLAAEIAATMTTTHPDYAKLAARISVSNLHKNTKKSFSETMSDLYTYVNPRTAKKAPLLSDEVYKVIEKNATGLVELIEKGIFSGEKIENILKKNLNPMIQNKIDQLVLGCTHYPILIKTIKSLIPSHIKILDSGKAVAKQTNRLLIKNKSESNLLDPSYTFYCNGSDQSLNKILNFKFTINII